MQCHIMVTCINLRKFGLSFDHLRHAYVMSLQIIWLFNLLKMSVPEGDYSRNTSYKLKLDIYVIITGMFNVISCNYMIRVDTCLKYHISWNIADDSYLKWNNLCSNCLLRTRSMSFSTHKALSHVISWGQVDYFITTSEGLY